MKALHSPLVVLLAISLFAASALADTVKDREGAVRQDKAAMENDARWAYNDVQRGFAEAKRTGKPLLVVLRCVPCLSCAGIDAAVLTEPSLTPLLDQFVCARVINANALDLSLFQFDYDLSLSALMFNADGTVYGRFGSWTHQKNQHDKSTAGFKRTLETVLEIHRGYPANKATLAGKQGAPMPYKTPVNIPTLDGKYRLELDWQGKVVPSCVHCHQIGDALRLTYRKKNEPVPSNLIYPMPAPDTLGMTLAQDGAARVESVSAGSAAERAGFQPGDDIISFAGQRPVSIADVAWALHRSPESGSVTALVNRGPVEKSLKLELAPGWRSKSDISRRVGTWEMRAMATGGLLLEDLSDETRASRNLKNDALALLVKHVGQYGKHAAAKKAGFQKDDVIVEIDGLTTRHTEGEVIGHLLQRHRVGEQVKATVLRGEERVELSLPMQ
jgi:membrane-associated protease RseP (regulator of RpoE activity)